MRGDDTLVSTGVTFNTYNSTGIKISFSCSACARTNQAYIAGFMAVNLFTCWIDTKHMSSISSLIARAEHRNEIARVQQNSENCSHYVAESEVSNIKTRLPVRETCV